MIGALVGCVAAARTVAAGGGALVTDGLVLHLDPSSYSSGQVWANSVTGPADGAAQTAYDYNLGSTSSADSNDPTHAGSYWLFGGDDYFTAKGVGAHRYWRLKNLTTVGSYLEISEIGLFDGATRIDSDATLSTYEPNLPPDPLANLKDGVLTTKSAWTQSTAQGANFYFAWDFGSARTVTGWSHATFDQERYISGATLEYSDDGTVWAAAATWSGLPGFGVYTWGPRHDIATFINGMHKAGAQWTIEVWWYRGPSASQVTPIWDSGTSDQSGADMSRGVLFADQGGFINPDGRWGVRIKNDSGGSSALNAYLSAAPAIDTWHHHAVSFTGGAGSFLWLDGAVAACNLGSTTWDGTLSSPGTSDPTNPARIGARGDAAWRVSSGNRLGMLRIYNRPLSQSELLQNWNAERAGFVGTSSGHRYWRWVNFQIPGSYLEISELRVVDGSGTRYAATMTASTAPDFGTLAALADSDTDSRPYWAASTAEDSGFWIQADLGSAQPVAGMQMASYDTSDRFPSAVTLQWSDDGSSWTTFGTWAGLTYPDDKTWDSVLTPWVEFAGSEYPNVYAEQSYVVPVSASTLVFEMWGGSGKSSGAGGLGGAGAYLRGEFPVTPGETLTLGVAGVPEFETAYSCAGGGSSAILRGSTVIAVAAGGGGACWDVDGTSGGDPDASTGPTGSGGGATQSTPGAAGSELYGGQAGLGDGTGGYGSRVPLPETVSFSSGGTGWSYGGGSLYVAGSPASGGGGGGGYKGGGGGGIGGSGGGGSSYFNPSVIGGTYTEGSPGLPAGSGSQNFDLNIANGVYGKVCLMWKP